MLRSTGLYLLCAALASVTMGCDSSGPSGTPDGGSNPDGSVPNNPGFPATLPQVVRGTGNLMTSPRVVPIFYSNDTMTTALVNFLNNYVSTSVSYMALSEYGIGKGSVMAPVTIAGNAPMSVTDANAQTTLGTMITAGMLPQPDGNTLYMFHYPTGTTVTRTGLTSCKDFAAYHDVAKLSGGASAPYAIIPRCSAQLQLLTLAQTHELEETVTDPVVTSYMDLNDPYGLWPLVLAGAEVADMCQMLSDSFVIESSSGVISRFWSNKAMMGYHNPCVPAPKGGSLIGIPVLQESTAVNIGGRVRNVEVANLLVGQARTVNVRLISDLAPGPSGTLQVQEVPLQTVSGQTVNPVLNFNWMEAPGQTKVQGQAGGTLHLSITASSMPASGFSSFVIFTTQSLGGGQTTQTLWVGGVSIR